MTSQSNGGTGVREMFLRTIAVLGLLAVLILGAWGIIVLATSIPHLFERTGQDVSDSMTPDTSAPQTSVVVTNSNPGTTVVPSAPVTPKPVVSAPAPTYSAPATSYVPAPTRPALYGLPDLMATVQNVYPVGNGLTNVQFSVANVGSNVAQSGWAFNAQIPWGGSYYTYAGPAQQALYPGDKIVYVLGFDSNSSDSRYNNNNYDSHYNDDRYAECGRSHSSWDANDWQDWYQDAFNTNSNSRNDWSRSEWADWYDNYCGDYDATDYNNSNYNNNNNSSYNNVNGTITIIVDPANRVYESNESNNSVSVRQ